MNEKEEVSSFIDNGIWSMNECVVEKGDFHNLIVDNVTKQEQQQQQHSMGHHHHHLKHVLFPPSSFLIQALNGKLIQIENGIAYKQLKPHSPIHPHKQTAQCLSK